MTEDDEIECVVIPDSQESLQIPTDHFPQAVVSGENLSLTWSRHVPDEPEGEQGQPVGQEGGAGGGEGVPEGGNEPGQQGGDAGVPPGGGGGGGDNQGGAGGAGGNGGGGGGGEDNPEEDDDDEGHEEEGYVTTTTSSSTGGSLPPLVPVDPEAMLGQGYIPVLVSDEEHFAAGAGQMMCGDAPSEPEQCEEQAGGQELDSSESGGGLSEASTAPIRGPGSHGNLSSPSSSSAGLTSPARASSRAISSTVSSLSSFSSSDEGRRRQQTPQPSTSGAQRKRPIGRRGDPVAAKRQKLDVSSSTDTSGRETSGHDTTSSAATTSTSDTSHDDAPGGGRSADSGGGRRRGSFGGDDPSGDRERKSHRDPSGGSCEPGPGPSGVGRQVSDRPAYGTVGRTMSLLDGDVRESMVVETLSLSQEDAESLSCIPPSQDEYNGRLPFLDPGSPTDHETTVIERDIESTAGCPATLLRGTNPQEFQEWQSMSIMDYGSFENNGQKVETDGSQRATNSLTFGCVSQSTNNDDSVQFMGFENGKTSGVPSQISGGFENTNIDLYLTQTQDDTVCPPTTSIFPSSSQQSTCHSSQDPGFPVVGPQPASDVGHQQQRDVVLFPSSTRSESVSSNKQDDDLEGSKPRRPLTGAFPSIKDLGMDGVESSEAETQETKNPVDETSDITYAKEHQTVLKFADTSQKPSGSSSSSSKKAKPRSNKRSSKNAQNLTDRTPLGNENDQTDQRGTSPNSVPDSLVEDTQEYHFTAVKAQVRKSVEAAQILPKSLSDPQSIMETDSEIIVNKNHVDDAKDRVETPVSVKDQSFVIRSLSASQSRQNKNKNGDNTKRAPETLANQIQDMPQKNSKFTRHGSNQWGISAAGKVHVTTKVKSVYERCSTYLTEYSDGKLINMSLINEEHKLLKNEIETFEDILSPVSTSRSGLSLSSGDLADVSSLEQKSSSGSFKSGTLSMISPIAAVSTPAKGKPESLTSVHSDGVMVESGLGNDTTLNPPRGSNNLDRESVLTARLSTGTRSSFGSNRFSEVLFSDLESERASFGKGNQVLRRSSESLFSSVDHLSNRSSTASTRVSDIARVSDISARVSDISPRTSDASSYRASDASVRSDTIVEEASVTLCKSGSPAGGRVSGDDAFFRQPLPPMVKRRSSGSTNSSGSGGLRRDSGAAVNQVEPSGKLSGNQDAQLGLTKLEPVDRQEASSTSGMIPSSMESVIPNTCPSTGANLPVKVSRGGLDDNSRVTSMEVSEVPERLSEKSAACSGVDLSDTTVESADKTPVPGSSKRFPYHPGQSLDQGTPVLALWKDKHYYPARVLSCSGRGKYSVLFDDGNQMDVKASQMIKLDLVPVGKSVLADCGSQWNELVTVLSYWTDGSETGYVVRRPQDAEDGSCDVNVRRSQISLSREQAASIVPEIRTPASAIKNSGTSEKKKRGESQGKGETSSSVDAYMPRIQPFMIGDKSEHLESGVPVFAKWSDRHFYPGHLKAIMSSDAFVVTFEDGNESCLSQSSVFVCDLLPSGLDVMAEKDNENWSEEATVVGHYWSDDMVGYVVKFADGRESRVSRKGVTLNQAQAVHLLNQLQSERRVSNPLAPIGLDNALDSKRKRPRGTSPWTTPATNPPARSSQRPRNQHKMRTPSTADGDGGALDRPDGRGPTGEPPSALGSITSSKKKKTYLADLNPKASSTPTPKQYKDSGASSSATFKNVVDSPDMGKKSSSRFKTSLFPPQPGGSRIFDQMTFILTHVEKTAEQREKERKVLVSSPRDSSTSGFCIISSQANDATVPFDKGSLCQQIEANGGEVMDEFDLEKIGSGINCFLVSDACQRTRKYFCALAVGIPCVSHLWIQESCARGVLEDFHSYMLPSGISLETNQLVPWQNAQRPLAGLTVVVTTKNTNFIDVWMEILEAAGCNLAPKIPARISAGQVVHVVISDNHIGAATYQSAQKRGIPVVSSEWVVQCLVTGCKVNHNDHPKYRHDYE